MPGTPLSATHADAPVAFDHFFLSPPPASLLFDAQVDARTKCLSISPSLPTTPLGDTCQMLLAAPHLALMLVTLVSQPAGFGRNTRAAEPFWPRGHFRDPSIDLDR